MKCAGGRPRALPGRGWFAGYRGRVSAQPIQEELPTGFSVRLDGFEGPFDALLQLIAKRKLEVTELSLHTVTDEFLQYIRAQGPDWDLDEASYFLLVATTLLDVKVVKLLPGAEVDDQEDLALLEVRDLLFARLLQYRAYKEVSAVLADMIANAPLMVPRTVGLDRQYAGLLPDVVFGLGPDGFAALALQALTPKPVPTLSIDHMHAPVVNVAEQKDILADALRVRGRATFRDLIHDAGSRLIVVGRFLALLELFRDGVVRFEQERALAELTVIWTEE